LKSYAKRLGVADLTIFKGLVSPQDVKYYIKAANVVLIPPFLSST